MVRLFHNKCKVELLHRWCQPRSSLLDVGTGRGGDLLKWSVLDLNVTAVEPDKALLNDAKGRWYKNKCRPHVHWVHGDVRTAPRSEWNCISYMFSLHWILEDDGDGQFREAMERLSLGGVLIGIVPNGDAIKEARQFTSPDGQFWVEGDRVNWKVEGPFYNDTVINEPILTRGELERLASLNSGQLVEWEPLAKEGLSSFYSTFVVMKF